MVKIHFVVRNSKLTTVVHLIYQHVNRVAFSKRHVGITIFCSPLGVVNGLRLKLPSHEKKMLAVNVSANHKYVIYVSYVLSESES